MHITQITIKNFKCFQDVTLELEPNLNVFTGVNNSGKTTVLEAIALWAECFTKLWWQTGKADHKRGLNPGQYRLGSSQPHYENPADMISVRSPNFYSIFYNRDHSQSIEIACTVESEKRRFELTFKIKATRGSNYQLSFLSDSALDHAGLNQAFKDHAKTPIGLMYAAPVAAILSTEEFQTGPKLKYLISTRQATQVLRNRLYRLNTSNDDRWSRMLEDASRILDAPVAIRFETNAQADIDVRCHATVGNYDVPKDISLLGSGSLQIIEMLLNLYSDQRALNLVLLDEPDSHIHRDIQRRLIPVIRRESNHQIFISTHNESLIRSVQPEHIFHLDENTAEGTHRPIATAPIAGMLTGLQPSPYLKVLTALGNETALDYLNALEAERLILVEGEDDARHIQAIRDSHGSRQGNASAMYWAFGGLDSLLAQIRAYQGIFTRFRNQKSLWEKAVLVFDRDRLTTRQRELVMEALADKLDIPVYIWRSYTIEATLLSELDKLAALLVSALELATDSNQRQELNQVLRKEHERYRETISAHLRSKKFELAITQVSKDRGRKFADVVKQSQSTLDIPQPDVQRLQAYRTDAEERLADGFSDHLADKDNVKDIVRAVYTHFHRDAEFDERTWFENLIRTSSRRTTFEQWDELLICLGDLSPR